MGQRSCILYHFPLRSLFYLEEMQALSTPRLVFYDEPVCLTHPKVPKLPASLLWVPPLRARVCWEGCPALPRQVGHLLWSLLCTQPSLPDLSPSSSMWRAQEMDPGRPRLSSAPSAALLPTGPGEGTSPLLLLLVLPRGSQTHSPAAPRHALHRTQCGTYISPT
uniref:Uncharacterized protein n=1 Tax=Molossus molossus TaxID=27622 RepID=A0A7J8DBK9_MOLMO|nr:hypothetical protein HJG59_009344 [Molossus molossus]